MQVARLWQWPAEEKVLAHFSKFPIEKGVEKKCRRRIDHREKIVDRQVLSCLKIEHQAAAEPRVEHIEHEVGQLRQEKHEDDRQEQEIDSIGRTATFTRRAQQKFPLPYQVELLDNHHFAGQNDRQRDEKNENEVEILAHQQTKEIVRAERGYGDDLRIVAFLEREFEPERYTVDDAEETNDHNDGHGSLLIAPLSATKRQAYENESIDRDRRRQIDLNE